MRITLLISVLSVSLSFSAVHASELKTKSRIFPKNNVRIYPTSKNANGMTEEKFLAISKRVYDSYAPIIEAKGASLEIVNLWNDPSVDGYADRVGNRWQVVMYGGLARYYYTTADAVMLVACHEIGHHLGGIPMYPNGDWASNEGQSDYFAALKCMKRILEKDDNVAIIANMTIDEPAARQCEMVFKNANEAALCQRIAMAGKSIAQVNADLAGYPYPSDLHFDTPDPLVVGRTNNKHPLAQCRMDTFFSGALCDRPFTEDVSETSPIPGTCIKKDGYKVGTRPLCWYKPGDDEI